MALEKLEGRITVPTGGYTFDVTEDPADSATITVAAGDYYLTSTTSILTTIQTALNAAGLGGTYTVSIDDNSDTSLGKVTISATGITSFAITWTAPAPGVLGALLGFTGDVAAPLSATGAEQAEYLWLPPVMRTNPTSPNWASTSYSMGYQESDFIFTMAPSGASKRTVYNRRFAEHFEWGQVIATKMKIGHETTVNGSLEKFWQDVFFYGYPFRYHPDRSSDTVFWTFVNADAGDFKPAPEVATWEGVASLWRYSFLGRKLV